MTTDQESRSTRDRILDVAMELFAEEGYLGTRISEVERRAGLVGGSGSLYRHFPSKDALLKAAVEREMTCFRSELAEAQKSLPPYSDPAERRLRSYELRLHALRRSDRLFRLMQAEGDRVPELRNTIRSVLQLFAKRNPHPDNMIDAIAESALGGYHLFAKMQGVPHRGVKEEEFLRALVAMTEPLRTKHTETSSTAANSGK